MYSSGLGLDWKREESLYTDYLPRNDWTWGVPMSHGWIQLPLWRVLDDDGMGIGRSDDTWIFGQTYRRESLMVDG